MLAAFRYSPAGAELSECAAAVLLARTVSQDSHRRRLQAVDAGFNLSHRRQHENRHRIRGAQIVDEIETALARHHPIQDDEIELKTGHSITCLASVGRHGDAKFIVR